LFKFKLNYIMNNNSSNIGILVLSTVAIGIIGTGITLYNYKDYLFEYEENENDNTLLLKNDELELENKVIENTENRIINKKKKKENTKKSKIRKSNTKRRY
jgi:hypothetical protein